MPLHPRKRSKSVRLALMGAAAGAALTTSGCGQDVQRNRYASMEDCIADYSVAQCHADYPLGMNGSMFRGGRGLYVFGPWYRPDVNDPNDAGPGRYGRRTGTGIGFSSSGGAAAGSHGPTSVEAGHRGGFGGHGVSARS